MGPLILLYALLFFIFWGMSRPVLRFLEPLAPFLALGAAYGYEQGITRQEKGSRAVGRLFCALLLLSSAEHFLEVGDFLSLFRVPLGFESRGEYLSRKL